MEWWGEWSRAEAVLAVEALALRRTLLLSSSTCAVAFLAEAHPATAKYLLHGFLQRSTVASVDVLVHILILKTTLAVLVVVAVVFVLMVSVIVRVLLPLKFLLLGLHPLRLLADQDGFLVLDRIVAAAAPAPLGAGQSLPVASAVHLEALRLLAVAAAPVSAEVSRPLSLLWLSGRICRPRDVGYSLGAWLVSVCRAHGVEWEKVVRVGRLQVVIVQI